MIGIYKITNIKNGDSYIGQSLNISKRWRSHLSCYNRNGTHYEYYIYRAFRKYGVENFRFEVLEECSVESLTEREQWYYEKLKPTYNIIEPKENPSHNEVVIKKMKESAKKSWTNNPNRKNSLKNLKNNDKFPPKSVIAINLETEEIEVFKSCYDAEKKLGISRSSISQILNIEHKRTQSKGYTFEWFVKK